MFDLRPWLCKDEGLQCKGYNLDIIGTVTPTCEEWCKNNNNSLVVHHGDPPLFAITSTLLDTMIDEVINWGKSNTQELVVIELSHFGGGNTCKEETKSYVKQKNIKSICDSGCDYTCSIVGSMPISTVKANLNVTGSATIVAIFEECVDER